MNHVIQFFRTNLLVLSVFITGACVLVIEVSAVRALSPFYGNTMFSVSSVLSVILAALSLGYYVGGRLADQRPYLEWFFKIILLSSVLVLTFYLGGRLVLPSMSSYLPLDVGPLLSALLLFFVPALLLGTLSPFAVALESLQTPQQGVGSISGRIFFWSTLGSITGSLLSGFVLIPRFGIDRIFIGTSVVLFLLGFIPLLYLTRQRPLKIGAGFLALLFFTSIGLQQVEASVRYSRDGVYEKLVIRDDEVGGRPVRVLQQDRSASGAMYLDSDNPGDLVYDYTKYTALYKLFIPKPQSALVIGGGAYSIPKALMAEQPELRIDVSEIEPSLFPLAKQYFGLHESPNLFNYTVDGRQFLKRATTQYDLIFSDVYFSLYSIPAHFTTQEFFTLAKERLSADGVFIANIIGNTTRDESSFVLSEMKTFQSVFQNCYFFAVDDPATTELQNIIMVGSPGQKQLNMMDADIAHSDNEILRSLSQKSINLDRFNLSPYPLLTDNYAPVESLTARFLVQAGRQDPEKADGREMLELIKQQLRYGPRYLDSPGHERVKEFLRAELQAQTDDVLTQRWTHQSPNGKEQILENVVGRIRPTSQRRIILGTHYDTKMYANMDQKNRNQFVPGANDGASGVAVLLHLAQRLKSAQLPKEYGVDIVFFDGEEGDVEYGSETSQWVALGSTYFAQHLDELYEGNSQPEFSIIVDMVCDQDLSILKEQNSMTADPDRVKRLWEIAARMNRSEFVDQIGTAVQDDHTSLNAVGIPSILLIDLEYPAYHAAQDTADKCSEDSLESVASVLLEYIRTTGLN